MKSILKLIVLILCFTTLPSWADYSATVFSWTPPQSQQQALAAVVFRNGVKLMVENDSPSHRQIVSISSGRAIELRRLGGMSAKILAAYPSKDSADVVIAQVWSGGMAFPEETWVIYPRGTFVEYYSAQQPKRIEGRVVPAAAPEVIAKGIPSGTNSVGDRIFSDLKLLPGIGFVNAKRFKQKYARLAGQFGVAYFNDRELREPAIRALGEAGFKELRTYMQRSGFNWAIGGRWLFIEGCHAQACGAGRGLIVIDGEDEQVMWVAFDSSGTNVVMSGSSRKSLDPDYIVLFNATASEELYGTGKKVELRPDGTLAYEVRYQ